MINRSTAVLVLTLYFGLIGPVMGQDKPKLTDSEISKRLIGKWAVEENGRAAPGKGTIHYKSDRTMIVKATIGSGAERREVTVQGTWKVENGVLITTVDKADPEGSLPKGHVNNNEIQSIDAKTLILKAENGRTIVRKKVSW